MGEVRMPQLTMILRDLDHLPEVRLPPGYEVHRFRPGDEQGWVDVLNSTGSLGQWTLETVKERTAGGLGSIVLDAVHLVTYRGKPVATACLQEYSDPQMAELGWVATSPDHQGKGLGYQVCVATLWHIRERGFLSAYLKTDDQRFAAIKSYLKLDFKPWLTDPSHRERWRLVLPQLGYSEDIIPRE